jgi:aspartate-semialdehyde dehydrogenase
MKYGLQVALVDPTTLLGRDVKAVLSERAFPVAKLHLFHSREEADGYLTEEDEEAAFVAPLEPDSLDTCAVAFFCGDPAHSARFFARRGDDACLAIDLSGVREGGPFAPAAEPGGPGLLPEGRLLLTYDPTAFVLGETVRLLDRLSTVESITAAIDRPASELGKEALDELFGQAIAVASFKPIPKEVFDTQSAFNVFSPADSAVFERRVAEDVKRIVGRDLGVTLLSARAGVFHGHLIRLDARFSGSAPEASALREALFRPGTFLEEVDPENLSGPVESAGRDETLVLRVTSAEKNVTLTMAADHLRRGGALQGVRLAEQAIRERSLLADA